jgi:hypothetical protein
LKISNSIWLSSSFPLTKIKWPSDSDKHMSSSWYVSSSSDQISTVLRGLDYKQIATIAFLNILSVLLTIIIRFILLIHV